MNIMQECLKFFRGACTSGYELLVVVFFFVLFCHFNLFILYVDGKVVHVCRDGA